MKKLFYILPLFVMLAAACHDDDDSVTATQSVTLNVDLALPADQGSRTMGDPGVEEIFLPPTQLWVFLAAQTKHAELVYAARFSTPEDAWILSADGKVYQYNDKRIMTFDGLDLFDQPEIRAYLVASHEPLSFTGVSLNVPAEDGQAAKQTITEAQLTRLCFNTRYGTRGNMHYISLRDVYSTPCNLSKDWTLTTPCSSDYYGTVPEEYFVASIISVVDTLYHVAAKVDFQWTASTSNAQPNVAQGIVLNRLPATGYVFRPTENANPGSYSAVYSKSLLGSQTADDMSAAVAVTPGNQWNGRAYSYMLQPANNILNYTFTTKNNASKGGYQGVADPRDAVKGWTSSVFASWYKVDLLIEDSTLE